MSHAETLIRALATVFSDSETEMDAALIERVREVHTANCCCYEGVQVGRDRVKRLMRAHGIQGAKRRGKAWRTTISDPTVVRRPELVQRQFTGDAA